MKAIFTMGCYKDHGIILEFRTKKGKIKKDVFSFEEPLQRDLTRKNISRLFQAAKVDLIAGGDIDKQLCSLKGTKVNLVMKNDHIKRIEPRKKKKVTFESLGL